METRTRADADAEGDGDRKAIDDRRKYPRRDLLDGDRTVSYDMSAG